MNFEDNFASHLIVFILLFYRKQLFQTTTPHKERDIRERKKAARFEKQNES